MVCDVCGWTYNEKEGAPDFRIAAGTKWRDVPSDFKCPVCGVPKERFHVQKSEVSFDPAVLRKFSYGLFVLTAKDGDKDNGCIINTGIEAASDPQRLSIAVNKGNFTHNMVANTGVFNLSILSENAPFSVFRRFGFQSGRDTDKFKDMDIVRADNGIPYVKEGTNAYVSAKVVKTMDLGSHTLFVADITAGEILSEAPSATYAYYHANIKPKKPKTE